MIGSSVTRANLEKFFPAPFSDYQWGLIVAQGYEDAIASGARTAEDVAEELKGLMEAAGRGAADSGRPDTDPGGGTGLTWDEMEKLVLGRVLAERETDEPGPVLRVPNEGSRMKRLFASRERNFRLWLIGIGSAVGVLVVALIVGLAFGGLECGSGGDVSAATSASDTTQSEAGAGSSALMAAMHWR